ncbi:MAG: hypothetical protein O3A00_26045 [Planctomycetota bacterium]|nr:hypothetical protein [Planctomycetota bacterium]
MTASQSQIKKWQEQTARPVPAADARQHIEAITAEMEACLAVWETYETFGTDVAQTAALQSNESVTSAKPGLTSFELILLILAVAVFLAGGALIMLGTEDPIVMTLWFAAWAIGGKSYHYFRQAYRCPSCGTLWARVHTDSTLLEQEQGYGTVTRRDEHRDRDFKIVGYTDREEQVHTTRETHLDHYECRFCGHFWFGTSAVEYEG